MTETCETCIYANTLVTEEYVLCAKYGIVSHCYHCKKYQYDLISKEVRSKRSPLMVKVSVPGD